MNTNRKRLITSLLETADSDFSWNRLELVYSASKPMKINISYMEKESEQNGKNEQIEQSDSLFLEAGENMVFHALCRGYCENRKASQIKKIEADAFSEHDSVFTFTLHSISAETIETISDDTYYIENESYKLGVKLIWGGGISFISDKKNRIPGLENLVNNHDTGRLIQQSYYGVRENDEYSPGEFMGHTWCYNPVQGGDRCGNKSRLIDLEVTKNSVYVKAQPQDWGHDNKITPSYMENRYTLSDDFIRVDNRFTDFSGWEHPCTHQELPAFYTVSYLDTFVSYEGEKPWQYDMLTKRGDLNFWGDPQYGADTNFPLHEKNSETWCAWINEAEDYGIGLYVPDIDLLKAGRYRYNGSKDPENDACNYVAPLDQLRITAYSPIEYSYLMKTGDLDTIRSFFYQNKDFADNSSLRKNSISLRKK